MFLCVDCIQWFVSLCVVFSVFMIIFYAVLSGAGGVLFVPLCCGRYFAGLSPVLRSSVGLVLHYYTSLFCSYNWKVGSAKNPELSKIQSFQPRLGQNITSHALLACRNSSCFNFCCSCSFIFLQFSSYVKVMCAMNSKSEFYLWFDGPPPPPTHPTWCVCNRVNQVLNG